MYLIILMPYFFLIFFFYKSICCGYNIFELQIKAIQMSTQNIRLYKETDKSTLTDCNLKTMKLLDCALIWVCVVIRLNVVKQIFSILVSVIITCSSLSDY